MSDHGPECSVEPGSTHWHRVYGRTRADAVATGVGLCYGCRRTVAMGGKPVLEASCPACVENFKNRPRPSYDDDRSLYDTEV